MFYFDKWFNNVVDSWCGSSQPGDHSHVDWFVFDIFQLALSRGVLFLGAVVMPGKLVHLKMCFYLEQKVLR